MPIMLVYTLFVVLMAVIIMASVSSRHKYFWHSWHQVGSGNGRILEDKNLYQSTHEEQSVIAVAKVCSLLSQVGLVNCWAGERSNSGMHFN